MKMELNDQKDYDFNYSEWIAIYPELSEKTNPIQANNYAALCVSYFNPTKVGSMICNAQERKNIFYLLVAHCAFFMSKNGDDAQLSGMINSVSEGSVSVGSDTSNLAKMGPWLSQSRYGQLFWALTAKYRSAFYIKPIPDPRLRIIM